MVVLRQWRLGLWVASMAAHLKSGSDRKSLRRCLVPEALQILPCGLHKPLKWALSWATSQPETSLLPRTSRRRYRAEQTLNSLYSNYWRGRAIKYSRGSHGAFNRPKVHQIFLIWQTHVTIFSVSHAPNSIFYHWDGPIVFFFLKPYWYMLIWFMVGWGVRSKLFALSHASCDNRHLLVY